MGHRARLVEWLARARAAPGRVEALDRVLDDLAVLADHDRELLERAHHVSVTNDSRLHVVLAELERIRADLHASVDSQAEGDHVVLGLRSELDSLRDLVRAPLRIAAMREIEAGLDVDPTRRAGVSALVEVRADRRWLESTLDSLEGEVDHITVLGVGDAVDGTPDGVRVIRAPIDLGTSSARHLLLRSCPTMHACLMGSGDTLDPDGLAGLREVAQRWKSAAATGSVVSAIGTEDAIPDDPATAPWTWTAERHVVTSEPWHGTRGFGAPDDDRLALLDTDAAIALVGGGIAAGGDEVDQRSSIVERLVGRGELVVHVPAIVGARRSPTDQRLEGSSRSDPNEHHEPAVAVIHPVTGPLWASAAAAELRPELGIELPDRHRRGRIPAAATVARPPTSVLVVGAGGAGHLVGDVETRGMIERLRTMLPAEVAIEVITDGSRPGGGWEPAVWLGTRREFARRLLHRHLAVVMAGGELSDRCPRAVAGREMTARSCERMDVPLLIAGASVGPFDHDRAPVQCRELLRLATSVAVRDPASARAVAALGLQEPAVLGCEVADHRVGVLPHGLAPRCHLTFQPMPVPPVDGDLGGPPVPEAGLLSAWARAIDEFAGARDLEVAVMALSPHEVEAVSRLADQAQYAGWHVIDAGADASLARSVTAEGSATVASSFSMASWSLDSRVPTVMTAADPRASEGLAELIGDVDRSLVGDPPAGVDDLSARFDAAPTAGSRGLDDLISPWVAEQLASAGVIVPAPPVD